MGKIIKACLWTIIAVGAICLIGFLVYNFVLASQKEVSHPEVSFEIKDYGTIKMELYPEYAPNTVANIIKLVENGYYNDKVIYGKDEICLYLGRNSEGEAVNPNISLIDKNIEEGSDGDYEYSINGEFIANDFKQNTLKHEKGVVTLIRNDYTQYFSSLSEQSYNSGNAQIAIMMDDAANLNGVYAAFGKVIEGMDILEKMYNELEIAPKETENAGEEETSMAEVASEGSATDAESSDENGEEESAGIDAFKTYPVITSATIDTKGVDYGMPETEEAFNYEEYMNNLMQQYYGGNQ